MNAVYKSKTSTGNASVNKRDEWGIWASASATAPICAMRLSVRFRTSNFSFSILACVRESGGGIGFFTISGIQSNSRWGGNCVKKGTDNIHVLGSYLENKICGVKEHTVAI